MGKYSEVYPTSTTYFENTDYPVECTANVNSITGTPSYSGWGGYEIGYAMLPRGWYPSTYEIKDGKIIFNYTEKACNFTYCNKHNNPLSGGRSHGTYIVEDKTPGSWNLGYNVALMNKFNVHQSWGEVPVVNFAYLLRLKCDSSGNETDTYQHRWHSRNFEGHKYGFSIGGGNSAEAFENFMDTLNGVDYIEFPNSGGGIEAIGYVKFGNHSLAEFQNGFIRISGQTSTGIPYDGYLYVLKVNIDSRGIRSDPTSDTWGQSTSIQHIGALAQVTDTLSVGIMSSPIRDIETGNFDTYIVIAWASNADNPTITYSSYDKFIIDNVSTYIGGFKFELEKGDSLFNSSAEKEFVETDTCIMCNHADNSVRIIPLVSTSDIRRLMSLMPSWYGYVPKFDENGVTEELTDDPEEMQDWQDPETGNITDNDYNGEIPEPGEEGNNPDNPDANLGNSVDNPPDDIESPGNNEGANLTCATNFITQYILSVSELYELGYNMWNGWLNNLQAISRNFAVGADTGTFNIASMFDFIISLRLYPFNLTAYGLDNVITYSDGLRMGTGHTDLLGHSVIGYTSLGIVVSCGEVNINFGDNTFSLTSDKSPDFRNIHNCSITVFLPYCGTVELNPSDVYGCTISCKYYVDLQAGTCTACIFLHRSNAVVMIASKNGQIGFLIPITATNAGQVTGQFISDATNVVSLIGNTIVSMATQKALGGVSIPMSSDPETAARQSSQQEINAIKTKSSNASNAIGIGSSVSRGIGDVISRAGIAASSMSGGSGIASRYNASTPYVIIRRSTYASPNNYSKSVGFVSTQSGAIGNFKGFNKFVNVDVSNIPATKEELEMIKAGLEHGVYV